MATKSCWRPTTARPAGLSRTSRIWSNGKLRSRRRQLLSVKPKIAARNKLKPADREKSGQPEKIQHHAREQEGGGFPSLGGDPRVTSMWSHRQVLRARRKFPGRYDNGKKPR